MKISRFEEILLSMYEVPISFEDIFVNRSSDLISVNDIEHDCSIIDIVEASLFNVPIFKIWERT